MAFGLNSKLTEEEKIQISLNKSLKKASRKHMLEDMLYAQKAKKEALKRIEAYKLGKVSPEKTVASDSVKDVEVNTNQTEVEKTSQNTEAVALPETAKKNIIGDAFIKAKICISEKLYILKKKIFARKKILAFGAGIVCLAAVLFFAVNFITCYDVIFDGHHIGIVNDLGSFNKVLDDLQNDLRERYGMNSLYFERSVVYEKLAVFDRSKVLSDDEMYAEAASADIPLFCMGAVITVNGEDTVKLASLADAEAAVKKFEDFCNKSEGGGISVINAGSFSTDKKIEAREKIITIGSDHSVDEATSYLISLVKNGAYAMQPDIDEKTLQLAFDDVPVAESSAKVTFTDLATRAAKAPFYDAIAASATVAFDEDEPNISAEGNSLSTALVFRADLSAKDDIDRDIILNVTTTREVEYVKEVPYSREEYSSSSYYIGEVVVTTPGVNGETKVRSLVTATNGIVSEEKILNESVITEPVTEMVANGTKPLPDAYSTGKFMIPTTGLITATNKSGSHAGFKAVDIANSEGTGIYASDSGVVSLASWYSDYGYCIIINHSDGYQTLYGHLSYIGVSVGQVVEKGENIARMGSTGYSTGPHLHFEIRLNGVREYIPAYFDNMWYGNTVYAFQ